MSQILVVCVFDLHGDTDVISSVLFWRQAKYTSGQSCVLRICPSGFIAAQNNLKQQ